MLELIQALLGTIPAFIISFINTISVPTKFLPDLYAKSDELKFKKALAFLVICMLITFIIQTTIRGKDLEIIKYLGSDAIWKIILLIVQTAIIYFSWHLFKSKIIFEDLFVINIYCFGALSVMGHLILLIDKQLLYGKHPHVSLLIIIFLLILVLVWMLRCWLAYIRINNFSLLKGYAVLLLVIIVSLPTYYLIVQIKDALHVGF